MDYFQKKHCKYVEVAQKQECQDMQHLEKFFQDVIDKGGEGIILRDPEAGLQPGRSAGYLKHKVTIIHLLSASHSNKYSYFPFLRNIETLKQKSFNRSLNTNGSVSCKISPPPNT